MRSLLFTIIFLLLSVSGAMAQTSLSTARELYKQGKFAEALPLFEAEYNNKPTDVNINHWYGVCLIETGGDVSKAEELLTLSSKRKIRDAFLYLGQIYTEQYRLVEAKEMFDTFEKHLKKRGDESVKELLEVKRTRLARLERIVNHTEDIQIIDSLVVDQKQFLSAYHMSSSTGKLDYFNDVFESKTYVLSTVYFNEKGTKIHYGGRNEETGTYSLYTREKLLENFGGEKKLSPNNFGLKGDINYPFLMTDGVTIYFAAEDEGTLGGYDLFVSRYNMNNDTFLNPERLNAPFNSPYNDYMMVIDDEKGIGWFASDRFQPDGKVCVYTFIPNATGGQIENEDSNYLASRAFIRSIKDTWRDGVDYTDKIELALEEAKLEAKKDYDFTFVINDEYTYHKYVDFKNEQALEAYQSLRQIISKMNILETHLQSLRDEYTSGSETEKNRLSLQILGAENDLRNMRMDIESVEIDARNLEVKSL